MRSHSGSVTRTFMACPPRVLAMVLQRTMVQPACQCFIFSERCKPQAAERPRLPMKSLRVPTCQFSVEADLAHNRRFVLRQMEHAARGGAEVVHFSEAALSGYAGVDIPDTDALDWDKLTACTRDVIAAAKRLQVWVLLGSTHRLS